MTIIQIYLSQKQSYMGQIKKAAISFKKQSFFVSLLIPKTIYLKCPFMILLIKRIGW